MPGSLIIPKYTSKDLPIMLASMIPMAMLLNYFLFGNRYFHEGYTFLWSTLITFGMLSFGFFTYGLVAISLRNRFPADDQTFRRLLICITIFFLMSAVYVSIFLISYDHYHFMGYVYNENDFINSFVSLVVVNVFLTFLNEGVYRYEKYRDTITETEQLKKEYIHSQLLGLKSQMNPHFLFNSLNTLSSLIQEDAESAEEFLDHMSKVYRYLLRNNEEQLVTIQTELNFIRSYYYLLQARHSTGLQLKIDVSEEGRCKCIPPLTLQMLIEQIMNQHSASRSHPLHIRMQIEGDFLEVSHNVQPKFNNAEESGSVIENISNKYRLLCQQDIKIFTYELENRYQLPLIPEKELEPA